MEGRVLVGFSTLRKNGETKGRMLPCPEQHEESLEEDLVHERAASPSLETFSLVLRKGTWGDTREPCAERRRLADLILVSLG